MGQDKLEIDRSGDGFGPKSNNKHKIKRKLQASTAINVPFPAPPWLVEASALSIRTVASPLARDAHIRRQRRPPLCTPSLKGQSLLIMMGLTSCSPDAQHEPIDRHRFLDIFEPS